MSFAGYLYYGLSPFLCFVYCYGSYPESLFYGSSLHSSVASYSLSFPIAFSPDLSSPRIDQLRIQFLFIFDSFIEIGIFEFVNLQTYEMVEDDVLEIGDGEHEQAQRAYTLCDGCEVVLSASDDIFETHCSRHHIVCSDCYNLWMRAFVQMDFVMTQDWRRQIERSLCPICDQVIVEEGKLNLHRVSYQIDHLLIHSTRSHSTNSNDHGINVTVHNPTTVSSASSMEMAPISATSSPPSININIQNIQNSIHITQSPGTTTNSDTSNSHSNFEMVSSADFGGLESSIKLP